MELAPIECSLFEGERADYAAMLRTIRKPYRQIGPAGLQLICVGNSGGATSVVNGKPSGAFLLRHADRTLIVDPGDNCVTNLVRSGFNPFEITDVLASHAHNDHVGDLSLAVSAAIKLGLTHSSDSHIVVAPSLVDYSNAEETKHGFTLPAYAWRAHVNVLFHERLRLRRFDGIPVETCQEVAIADGIRVVATEARHSGTPATGFVFETEMGKIGYTGDTEYFEGLHEWYQGVNVLWMNMNTLSLDGMVPAHLSLCDNPLPTHNHLGYVGACRLIEEVRPEIAIVSHFGAQLIDRRPEIEGALRARFAPLGVAIHCPDTMDCMSFGGSLSEPPKQGAFPC